MWRKYFFTRRVVSRLLFSQPNSASCIMQRRLAHHITPADISQTSSALKNIIFDKIRINGPITVAEFMKLAASGYYSTTAAATDDSTYGIGGDFVTSPEISQMFGELVGVWCAYETWKMGHHGPWQFVELGPGNGSLAFDFLRTLKQLRITREGDDHPLSVHLVERSEALAQRQERLLCPDHRSLNDQIRLESSVTDDSAIHRACYKRNRTQFGSPVQWYKDLDDVPRQFSVIIAHEFFDALPVHKFQRSADGKWREIYIDADFESKRFKFALPPSESFAQRTYLTNDVLERLPADVDHVEISPQSIYILQQAVDRITEDGGAILIIDYGYENEKGGDTLRAFRKHRIIDDFLAEEPASYDITADVNFGYLKRMAEGKVCCYGPVPQGVFLKNLGIDVRLKRLLNSAKTEEERDYLRKSFDMLVNDDKMGRRFKVLGLFPKVMERYFALRPPAGFTALE